MGERLDAELSRWTTAGIIDDRQAAAIRAMEASPLAAGRSTPRRRVLAEIVGSLGAIAAAVAAVVGVAVSWSELTDVARVGIPAIGCVGLLAAGATVASSTDSSSARLGALLLLLGCGALGATVAVLTTDILGWDDQNGQLATGLAVTGAALTLMLWRPTPHLQLALTAGLVLATVGLVGQYDRATDAQFGVALAALGAFVVLAGWTRAVPSPGTAYVTGAAISLVGAQLVGAEGDLWPVVIGAATALGLLAVFVADRDRAALVAGLVAAVVTIGQGVVRTADRDGAGGGGNTWLIGAVFAVGAGLVAAAVLALHSAADSSQVDR
jgi:hypothetical protein